MSVTSSLQIPYGVALTNPGNVDPYYGPWATAAIACTNVPSALRPYKTVGVLVSGTIQEYWWPSTSAVADTDLVVKTPDLSAKADKTYVDTQNAAEAAARINADALKADKTYVDSQDSAEASTRSGADTILQNNINSEATTRANADTTLQANIDAEASARATGDTGTLNSAKSYADSLLVSVYKDCGNWDASTGNFPTTGGTGTSGAIKAGNAFEVSVAGTAAGEAFDVGDIVRALVDTPGQTLTNWARSEHNTQQATETTRGTVKIADQTTIQTETSTEDQAAVTTKKFWLGIARLKAIAATITGAWNFTGGLQSGGNTVETQNNKATSLSSNDNTHYPTTAAVKSVTDANATNIAANTANITSNTTAIGLREVAANKDASGGYVGLTLFKINFWNTLNTFKSFLTNFNTAARTYTFPDKDITVAGIVDVPVVSTTLQATTGVDDTTFLSPVKGMALVADQKKNYMKSVSVTRGNPYQNELLIYYPNAGSITAITGIQVTNILVKTTLGGTYATASLPLAITAGATLYIQFDFTNANYLNGNITITGKDN